MAINGPLFETEVNLTIPTLLDLYNEYVHVKLNDNQRTRWTWSVLHTYIQTRQTKRQMLEVKTRPLPLLDQLIKYRPNIVEDFWSTFTTDAASKIFPWKMWAIHAMVGPNVNTIINLFNLLNFSTFWFLGMLKAFNVFALHYVVWEKVSTTEHRCKGMLCILRYTYYEICHTLFSYICF